MPDATGPAQTVAGVAVVLVGEPAAAATVAAGRSGTTVAARDAAAVAGAPAVVGLATAPWPGFAGDHDRVREAVAPTPYFAVQSWHQHPAYLTRLADALAKALADGRAGAHVLFTAPGRPSAGDGPDPAEVVFLRETAEAVSAVAGVVRRSIAWTSGSLGPSSVLALTALAEAHGRTAVVRCSLDPLGRPDTVAEEARGLGLELTDVSLTTRDLPDIVDAVVATVVAHEQLEGGRR